MGPPMSSVSRRGFLGTGAAAAAGLSVGRVASLDASERAPVWRASRPTVIASANGIRGVARAYEMLTKGADPLDAAIAGVNIQELDPEDQSVGLGGLPNADGVVQLDASCMHGPTRRARSEEHTSELQSRLHLVCRLLLEKKKPGKCHGSKTLRQCTEARNRSCSFNLVSGAYSCKVLNRTSRV